MEIRGKVAAILDTTSVVINLGAADGITKGEEFHFFGEMGPFPDPDTGEPLGGIRQRKATVRVSLVAERFCIARTRLRSKWELGQSISELLGSYEELPIDRTDLFRNPKEFRVTVGTVVYLDKPTSEPEKIAQDQTAGLLEEPGTPQQSEGNQKQAGAEEVDTDSNHQPENH